VVSGAGERYWGALEGIAISSRSGSDVGPETPTPSLRTLAGTVVTVWWPRRDLAAGVHHSSMPTSNGPSAVEALPDA
jgi:hypothetical protein